MKPSELMDRIFKRTEMYISRPSVEIMQAFVDGHRIGQESESDPLYHGFHDWVVERFGFGSSHSWCHVIAFIGVSEQRAFDLAKELWEEYKVEKRAA